MMHVTSIRFLPPDRDLAPLAPNPDVDYRDKFRGALLGVGIGDALGRPAEGKSPGWLRADYGAITDYIPWSGWQGGAKGTLTDDTELTIALAESLIERRQMDPVDFARRCAAWVHVGRGKGRATAEACLKLIDGVTWEHSGTASAGNGAAMRAAPVALFHPVDPNRLRKDAAISAVVTHADPTAVLSAAALAYLVAELLHTRPGDLDPDALLERVVGTLADLPDPELPERKPGGGTVRLLERMQAMGARLDQPPDELFQYTFNGAFVSESLPAALWCFLRSPEDPELVVTTAVNGGYDADTVAAMAGAMVGAYGGASSWPSRWVDDLEYRDGLEGCADDLLDLSELPHGEVVDSPPPAVERVDQFTGPFTVLSNGARVPIEIDGLRYPTVEHAYSSQKIAWEAVAAEVRLIPTPAGAIERRQVPAHDNWKRDRSRVMETLLAAKFAPGSPAANRLLATGNASLYNENWWGDGFWGTVDGIGENRLGVILADLRRSLRTSVDPGDT